MPASLYQVAIVGSETLSGRELVAALESRDFPGHSPRRYESLPPTAEMGEIDVVFLAGPDPSIQQRAAEWVETLRDRAANRGACIIDLSGAMAADPEAILVGMDPESDLSELPFDAPSPWLTTVAHPAAQQLSTLLRQLTRAGSMDLISATVFEPVSQRGWPAIQELEQQTTRLLALKSMPQEIFGAQIAFNLRAHLGDTAQPSLESLRFHIRNHLERLLRVSAPSLPVALEVLQAPIFHASVISLFVRFTRKSDANALLAAPARYMDSPTLRLFTESEGFPDIISAAGEDAIQVGLPRSDPGIPAGMWLFSTLDNLRRVTLSAVDAAAALLRAREHVI